MTSHGPSGIGFVNFGIVHELKVTALGLDQVPCQVVQPDRAQQAAAYAAVNENITKTTPQQLFHARLAAGDKNARELADVCSAGGVEITRRNLILARITVGQTQVVGALARCLKEYGRDTLITALQCITETSDGNAGFVRATIVEGLCEALNKSEWRDSGEALLRAMDDFSFPDAWGEITDGRDQIFPATVRRLFADMVTLHLAKHTPVLPSGVTGTYKLPVRFPISSVLPGKRIGLALYLSSLVLGSPPIVAIPMAG